VMYGQRDVTASRSRRFVFSRRVLGRRVNMSGLISSVKHVRYALGSLTAVLFSAASGASL